MFKRSPPPAQKSNDDALGPLPVDDAKRDGKKVSISLRYPKPKVLLIDLKDDSEAVLRAAGYNVHVGTFGTPFPVSRSNSYQVVPRAFSIPNYREQEIVVIDLIPNPTLKDRPPAEEAVEGDYDYWGKCNHGLIDPTHSECVVSRKF